MFLSNIRKKVFNFIMWKSINPKEILIVMVFNNFINIPLPNLMLTFPVQELSIRG